MGTTRDSKSRTPEQGAEGPAAHERDSAGSAHNPGESPPTVWIESKRPILRFVLMFALLMGPFTVFFYSILTDTALFNRYLDLNAAVSAGVLRVLGEDASSTGQSLRSPRASLEIRHGCDAILPTALFVCAILAFPVVMRVKWTAVWLGSAALLLLNLVRIITLYYTRIYKPDWFHAMHVDVWQPAFIFLALLFWVIWALRATRVPEPQPVPSDDATHEARCPVLRPTSRYVRRADVALADAGANVRADVRRLRERAHLARRRRRRTPRHIRRGETRGRLLG